MVHFRTQWKRLLQKTSLYLWSTDKSTSLLFDEVDLNGRGCNEVGGLFKAIMAKAKKANIKLPIAAMDIHLHNLRRTFGSYQALTGASLQVIGKSLGNKSSQATQIYARLNLDPVRLSMEKAFRAMF